MLLGLTCLRARTQELTGDIRWVVELTERMRDSQRDTCGAGGVAGKVGEAASSHRTLSAPSDPGDPGTPSPARRREPRLPATPGSRVPPAADSLTGHRLGTLRTRAQASTAHAPHAPPMATPADLGQSLSAGCGRCLGAAALVLSRDVLPVGDGVRVRTFSGLGSSASSGRGSDPLGKFRGGAFFRPSGHDRRSGPPVALPWAPSSAVALSACFSVIVLTSAQPQPMTHLCLFRTPSLNFAGCSSPLLTKQNKTTTKAIYIYFFFCQHVSLEVQR